MVTPPTVVAGRTAVITGAGSGIGRALAQRLAAHGCPVALCDWHDEHLRETEDTIAGPTFVRQLGVVDDHRDGRGRPLGDLGGEGHLPLAVADIDELLGTGVRAVSVHPGGVRTHIVDNARFHVDDQGGTDHAALSADFLKLARTSPEKAAQIIQTGVEKGKDRILVGPNAVALSVLTRLAPVRYYGAIERVSGLVRR